MSDQMALSFFILLVSIGYLCKWVGKAAQTEQGKAVGSHLLTAFLKKLG